MLTHRILKLEVRGGLLRNSIFGVPYWEVPPIRTPEPNKCFVSMEKDVFRLTIIALVVTVASSTKL
jgi:hypothetical protein